MQRCIFLLLLLIHVQSQESDEKRYDLKLIHEWKQIEYKFRSEEERSEAIANGTFHVGKVQALDVQYVYDAETEKERIFITNPRLTNGFPATLGIITNETRDGNPIIDPYPSWSWHINLEQCNYYRLVSVFRVWADECNRLWVVDNGALHLPHIHCPPQILTFDLKTDKLLYKYEIPYEQHQNNSIYVSPVAEIESRKNACENTWLYLGSPQVTPSLLVYSLKQNTSWKIEDTSFLPNPDFYNYTVDGDSFSVNDGLITVALTPLSEGPRRLRYHALSNNIESWVYTKYLKDPSNFKVPFGSPDLFYTYEHKRNQQASVEVTDSKGYLYSSLVIDTAIIKWDPKTVYKQSNLEIIAQDSETLQFASGLKISPYKNGSKEVLWILTSSYQRIAAGTLNGNRTNFRLFKTFL